MPQPDVSALRLDPFRGVRYRTGLDLAAVTAPPYDVLDAESVAELTASDEHNVVRLVLPQAAERVARGAKARATLDAWLADGTLVVDDKPALYVYEQSLGPLVRLRGLIGALGLRDPSEGIVLPHEDVMPWPVEDRASLQSALEAHVEPIWLVYDGGGPTSEVVGAATTRQPLVDVVTQDTVRHRLWDVSDPADLAVVREDLAGRQALIADGHHRYAAYREVQVARHEAGSGAGPWDSGLALLVDLTTHAPEVGAIHRVIHGGDGVDLSRCSQPTPGVAAIAPGTGDWREDLAALPHGSVLLVDEAGAALRLTLTPGAERRDLFAGDDADLPERWQSLDTALLHEVLLPAWGVGEAAVSYQHTAIGAVRQASRERGLALLLAPVDVADVLALAAQGVRMPRKSTSFGPKPRSGFVLRTFAAG